MQAPSPDWEGVRITAMPGGTPLDVLSPLRPPTLRLITTQPLEPALRVVDTPSSELFMRARLAKVRGRSFSKVEPCFDSSMETGTNYRAIKPATQTQPPSPVRGAALGRSASFLDGFGASIGRSLEFGMDRPPTSPVYRHLYTREESENNSYISDNEPFDSSEATHNSAVTAHNPAYEQAQLLLVSLLENFCALYDRNPDKNRRLFMAVCRQLWNMGILTSADFFNRSEKLRGVYKEAFRTLVLQAIQGIEANDGEARLIGQHEDGEHNQTIGDKSDESESISSTLEEEEFSNRTLSLINRAFDGKPVGSRLENEFRDLTPIGRGGFAQVLRGESRIDHCLYAFKRIEFASKNSETYEKIIREIKSLANLEHPNIVRYHGAWIEEKLNLLQNRYAIKCVDLGVADGNDASSSSSSLLNDAGTYSPTPTPIPMSIPIPVGNQAEDFEKEISPGYYMIIQMELCQFTLADWLEQRNFLISHSKPWRTEYGVRHIRPRPCIPVDRMATLVGPQIWDINPAENCRIFKGIVKALQHIHAKGIIHRDLKPGNILFQVDGDNYIPKIGDFGLASDMAHEDDIVSAGSFLCEDIHNINCSGLSGKSFSPSVSRSTRTTGLGTCMYAAPEQIRDCSDYNEKVDIYSLGIILFELFYPFATRMERHDVLEELKNGIIPSAFVKRWPKEATFIWSCISQSDETRPSAEQILESEILEQDPEETIDRLSKENNALKRLLEAERERVRLLEANIAGQASVTLKLPSDVEELSQGISFVSISSIRN